MTKMKLITTIIIAAYTITSMTACSSNSTNSITTSEVESTTTTIESIVSETTTSTESTIKVEITTTTPETTTTTVETTTVPETEVPETTPETTIPETTTEITTVAPETTTTSKPQTTTTTPKPESSKPQEKPSNPWTETECRSLTMDVLVDCNAYDKPISGANIVKSYKLNDRVKVVAKTDTGYYKLTDGSYIKEYNIRSYEDQGCYYKYDYPIYEWTEEEIFYVFDEVKKYADSVGFTNYDFPTEIMPYNESTKSYYGFNNYDMYKILGYEWEDNGYLWYRTKEEQMNDLIHDLKVFVDDHMDPDCAISSEKVMFTVTTAIDFQPHIKDTYNEKDAAILLDELNRHCYPDKCYILIYNF